MYTRVYPSLVVYKNIKSFLKNRNLELVSGCFIKYPDNKEFLNDDDFKKNIQFNNFSIIEAKDSKQKDRRYAPYINFNCFSRETRTFIIIFDVNTKINSDKIDNVLKKLPSIRSQTRDFNMDIIIITEEKFKTHQLKKLQQFKFHGSKEKGFISISNSLYAHFTSDPFSVDIVPKHRITSKEEEAQILKEIKVEKSQLPKILKEDVMCVAIGAEIGDLIEIQELSEVSAIEKIYRVVK